MNNKIIVYIAASIGVLVTAGLIWRGLSTPQTPQILSETLPEKGSIQITVSTTGEVKPQNRLEINPPISGRMESILVKEGETVHTGQILGLMSSTERAALLDAARLISADELHYWESVYQATAIVAPINGKVIVRDAEPGQTVNSSDTVFVISDRLMVQADVDEVDIGTINIGQSAIIELDAYPDVKAEGVVDHISFESTVSNNVTVYDVEIVMENIPEVFRSGMSANIEIIRDSKENILKIPQSLVHTTSHGSMVLIRSDNIQGFAPQAVKTGLADDTHVEITDGLTEQDYVVTVSQLTGKTSMRSNSSKKASNPFMPIRGKGGPRP